MGAMYSLGVVWVWGVGWGMCVVGVAYILGSGWWWG